MLRLSKLLNSFYFSVSYKIKFHAALVKLLILLDQLRRNKEVKSTENLSNLPPQIFKNGFWMSSTDLTLLQCHLFLMHYHALHHVPCARFRRHSTIRA